MRSWSPTAANGGAYDDARRRRPTDTGDDPAPQLRHSTLATPHVDEGTGAAQIATMNFIVFVDDPTHRRWVLERAANRRRQSIPPV